jgi:hypothetical protein
MTDENAVCVTIVCQWGFDRSTPSLAAGDEWCR